MIIFKATATAVEVRDAAFSTQYRYIRERASGTWGLPAGQTCGANVQAAGHTFDSAVRNSIYWRYECAAYTIEKTRQPTWVNNALVTVSQSLSAPPVTGSINQVAAP